ncbi:hypothetical protein ABW20_dc0105862 [Dactylellina cionopaga]|nr:hypothetical protein ABW20_dc0105862 [Dactylellina cionopaga]
MAGASASYYFVIIGTKDNPLYESEFGTFKQGGDGVSKVRATLLDKDAHRINYIQITNQQSVSLPQSPVQFREEQRHMNQFIAHSSLDCIEDLQWASKEMYLKTVDKFNNTWVSCFLTGGNEPVRQFFTDVYDLYCKTLMNPFYEVNMAIRSQTFDQKIKAAAKKYL